MGNNGLSKLDKKPYHLKVNKDRNSIRSVLELEVGECITIDRDDTFEHFGEPVYKVWRIYNQKDDWGVECGEGLYIPVDNNGLYSIAARRERAIAALRERVKYKPYSKDDPEVKRFLKEFGR